MAYLPNKEYYKSSVEFTLRQSMENRQEASLWKDNIVCHMHITSIEHIA